VRRLYPLFNDSRKLFIEVKTEDKRLDIKKEGLFLSRIREKVYPWILTDGINLHRSVVGKVRPARWYERILWRWLR
jgi:hypothetical protein